MSNSPSIAEDSAALAPDEAPDPSVLRAERRLRLLAELADIGMELARVLRPGADDLGAGEETAPQCGRAKEREKALVFAPLSRAIRLTLALEAKTDAELRDLKAGVARVLDEQRTVAAERRKVAAAKEAEDLADKIRCLVYEAAEAEIGDAGALSELVDALEERIEDDDAYFDLAARPLRETVGRLCADLTLSPDWSRWDGEGWVKDEPSDRPLRSPFNQPSARPFFPGRPAFVVSPLPTDRLSAGHDLE